MAPTAGEMDPYRPLVDPLVIAFWTRFGWNRFGDGLLLSDDPSRLGSAYAPWRLPAGRVPILRSAWGHLLSVHGDRSFLLDPLHHEERELGCDGVTAIDALLTVDQLVEAELLHAPYVEAVARIGRAPNHMECLTFVPALALGGSAEPRNAEIRDLTLTLDLLSQI